MMTEPIMKKRTLRCSDEDWDKISYEAEKAGMSASKFIVQAALKQSQLDHRLQLSGEDQEMLMNYIRLLAFDRIDQLHKHLSPEEVEVFLDRARSRYRPLEEG